MESPLTFISENTKCNEHDLRLNLFGGLDLKLIDDAPKSIKALELVAFTTKEPLPSKNKKVLYLKSALQLRKISSTSILVETVEYLYCEKGD